MTAERHRRLRGLPLSPGLAIGHACLMGERLAIPQRTLRPGEASQELARLEGAIAQTRRELLDLRDGVKRELGPREAEIFEAHLLFLDDPYLKREVEQKLFGERKGLEQAIAEVMEESERLLSAVEDAYLRERAVDLRDVGTRLLRHLLGRSQQDFFAAHDEVVVVAEELTPSQTVGLDRHKVKAFVTERGGATSHAAILARTMGVPLVSGVKDAQRRVAVGDRLIVDGYRGQVVVNPSADDEKAYRERRALLDGTARELAEFAALPSHTVDGVHVALKANVGTVADVEWAKQTGAEGIGLFRTEVLFLDRDSFPPEEEQFAVYRQVVEMVAPRPVVIRTIDIGGDKFVRALPGLRGEANPYLGLRAVRLSLEHPEMFRAQLRAVLRAGAFGSAAILVPMISSVDEVRRVKALLRQAADEVRATGQQCAERLALGVMIEIPSAALLADAFLQEADFVSVGTNDLIQYTLAVDRSNERVTNLYDPLNPAVLHLLKRVAQAAAAAGKEASLCGEMAGDPIYTELLIGLGFRELSMSPHFIPEVKRVVRAVDSREAAELADCVLGRVTSAEVRRLLLRSLRRKKLPGVLLR
ncbi:MAG: phosphoenolpyruvate--protein phosphotransferase [bacterium]|nr:phosphoenolpyruvate--protein phosphotransferase [candidate division KSB1 bacterium]MDH7558820.1 phosphoenolpyruvate--protein phosphotransferase [bacterium]